MIKLSTDCAECIMNKTCKYKNNAAHAMKKLKEHLFSLGLQVLCILIWNCQAALSFTEFTVVAHNTYPTLKAPVQPLACG